MKAYYSDRFVLPLPPNHSFPMAKYQRLRARVEEEAIVAPDDLAEAPAASPDELATVHATAYVTAVCEGRLDAAHQRRIGFPWSPGMVERSRRSVGATIAAARTALAEGTAANLAGGTHHAFADRGEGYCVFNDVAVAAAVLRREHPGLRIAVVDCDVHQGNGTAAIFRGDPSIHTFSIHAEKNFPFRKEMSDLDVMLPDGTEDAEYLDRLERALAHVFAQKPDFVFYLSGADPYVGDRLGRLAVSIEGLRRRDRLVLDYCDGLPVAGCMGGGYCPDIDTIVTIHANTVRELEAAARRTPA